MTDVLRLFGPLVLWLASFSAIYGLHGVSCAEGWGGTPLIPAWIIAVVLQAVPLLLLSTDRFGGRHGFARRTGLALAMVGFVAVIWTLAPVVFLTACV